MARMRAAEIRVIVDMRGLPAPIWLHRANPGADIVIGDYIDKHNDRPSPFVWTAKAADILEKVQHARALLDNG